MDYLKTIVPSQLIAERGANLVVINPGSANVRIGLAQEQTPFDVPQFIAHHMRGLDKESKLKYLDQILNSQITPSQHLEREKAYDTIASLLKIPFLDEEVVNNTFPRKTVRVDGCKPQSNKDDSTFTWTNVMEKSRTMAADVENLVTEGVKDEPSVQAEGVDGGDSNMDEYKFRESICGEEALKISPEEPYSVRRPIRRGHFNVSQHYPLQQVLEDLHAIWDWVLNEKLHIPQAERNMYSAILVVPETFDSREIKEMLSIILRDLRFSTAVVHQESLAAAFGNGLSTACIVNMGAQVTSIMCVEDGVAVPTTGVTLPFGGEDISRCLLWIQRHHQTWPSIHTDPLGKPVDIVMLNKLKETNCQIQDGEIDAIAIVRSYEGVPAGAHKTKLTALNVYIWHMDYPKDGVYVGPNGGASMWDNYQVLPRLKKEDNVGLAEAISKSILSTGNLLPPKMKNYLMFMIFCMWKVEADSITTIIAGRIDLQRKLFCSILLVGGVAKTTGLVPAVEERVLHAIPSNEAIDTVEVLPSRSDPTSLSWKGGAILAMLDFGREAWIHREDWIRNGIHIGSGRKYRDSFFLQAQVMCYMNL
ncbi:hypothetical protein MKW92_031925 [Papaver armeniacum]|nr:hypothetical protein MKW92_031925 [Papaver armeniacum]